MGRKIKDESEKLNGAERVRKHRDSTVAIDDQLDEARTRIDWKRRNAAEKSLEAWIVAYGIGVFINDPPPKPYGSAILRDMEEAGKSSRPYQVLVGRGGGKTSYAEADAAKALATGACKLLVISSINAKQAHKIKREIEAVFTSEPFLTDYPDVGLPIALLGGHGRRSQTYNGVPTKVKTTTDETLLPTIVGKDGKPAPSSGSCIVAKALKSVRGTKNGTQRPDKVILDDLQTPDIAKSQERVAEVLSLIRGDVMGLAGKGKMSITFTATTIAKDDVTEQLAADPVWKTTRHQSVVRWPKEWAKQNHGLWGEYFRMFDEENANDRKHTCKGGSVAFYRANRKAMDDGADVMNWDSYDRAKGQISGLQKLMDKYHEMGDAAFMAEYQMDPPRLDALFEISPKMVLSRVRKGVERGGEMPGCVFTAAATDINPSYALSTAIMRFDIARTAMVVAYFVERCSIDSTVNDTAYNRKIYDLLADHVRAVRGLGIKLDAYGVDCGGKQWDAVTRFGIQSQLLTGVQVTPMVGRAGRNWNPNVRTRIRNAINDTVFCRDTDGRVWLAFDADNYREQMQRCWGAETGSPGGISLYDGGDDHTQFAIQLSNERLVAKVKGLDGRFDYRWKTREPHDFGDCCSMCLALAGARCISGGSSIAAPPPLATANGQQHQAPATPDSIEIGCDF